MYGACVYVYCYVNPQFMYVRVKVVSMMLHAVTLTIQEMFWMQLVQYSYTTLYMGHKITQTMME